LRPHPEEAQSTVSKDAAKTQLFMPRLVIAKIAFIDLKKQTGSRSNISTSSETISASGAMRAMAAQPS